MSRTRSTTRPSPLSFSPICLVKKVLAKMLWGETSPSGKVSFTVAKKESDYAPNSIVADHVIDPTAVFTGKLLLDEYHSITPRFAFGHGLSYMFFEYSGSVTVQSTPKAGEISIQPTKEKLINSDAGLYDTVLTLETEITNTGSRAASEVVQLCVNFSAERV